MRRQQANEVAAAKGRKRPVKCHDLSAVSARNAEQIPVGHLFPSSVTAQVASRIDVLVIDDWAMAPLTEPERRDFWEICEDRYQVRSMILTSRAGARLRFAPDGVS